jgi:PAS domain-containing protein
LIFKKFRYCNEQFFDITGHPPVQELQDIAWQKFLYPDDLQIAADAWKVLLEDKKSTNVEFRTQKLWKNAEGAKRQAWVQAQTYPEFDIHGNVTRVLGILM